MHILKKWNPDPSKGEVFTPIELVSEMIDRIPSKVWNNPKSLFLDPCMGKGTFLIEIVRRLVDIYGYSELDAKSRVFGFDIRIKYVNYLKRRGYINVQHKDFLYEKIKMEFDVILGNPPYHKQVGGTNTEAIWPKFVEKSFAICKEGGYVCLIHPSGWRNVDGKFKSIQKLLLSKSMKYLEIHNEKDGSKTFGAETRYDWYIVENIESVDCITTVKGQRGKSVNLSLNDKKFIPNDNIETIYNLVGKNNDENTSIISDSSYHIQRNYMSKTIDDHFKYSCVYTVKKGDNITLWYSNTKNNGHFGIPKLIWSNFRICSAGSFIDELGEYGLTQFSYGLIDNPDILPLIKKVFDSKIFRDLMEDCAVSDMSINRKIIATFRKDFWKDFIDDDGNIIEPNTQNNVERV